MKRCLMRFNGREVESMLKSVKYYESRKRLRYDPEKMPPSMNPDYWRDYLDEIGRLRLMLRDSYRGHIEKAGTKVKMCAVNLTDAQAMIIEHAIDEWRRAQKERCMNEQEQKAFYIQEADAHAAELRIREAFKEERKVAL